MKKYIISVLLLSAGFSFASAQTADVDTSSDNSCAIITSNLRYLSRDANGSTDVSILQDFLNTRGYLKSQPTGFFGSATRRAVIAFQNDNGLRATPPGYVGPGTRAKIKEIDCNDTSAVNTAPVTTPATYNNTPTYTPPTTQVTNNTYTSTYIAPTTADNSFSLLAPITIERGDIITRTGIYANICWKSGKDNKDQTINFGITTHDNQNAPYSLGSANLSQGCFVFTVPTHLVSGGYVVTAKSNSTSLSASSPSFTLQGNQ